MGQLFTSDSYFHGRPSAIDYNTQGSSGSNKGPSNPDHLATVQARIDTFLVHNPGVSKSEIPSELVTASGSGLDPHLSAQAARVQVQSTAAARGLSEVAVQQLIDAHTDGPLLGLFGTPTINVLEPQPGARRRNQMKRLLFLPLLGIALSSSVRCRSTARSP